MDKKFESRHSNEKIFPNAYSYVEANKKVIIDALIVRKGFSKDEFDTLANATWIFRDDKRNHHLRFFDADKNINEVSIDFDKISYDLTDEVFSDLSDPADIENVKLQKFKDNLKENGFDFSMGTDLIDNMNELIDENFLK